MKKLFVLLTLGIALLSFTAQATGRYPDIVVNKHDGGWSALLNLYNEVVYTPSEVDGIAGTLECSGLGYSACRAPRINALGARMNTLQVPNTAIEGKLMDAVNELIANSETAVQRGTMRGSSSKTIAVNTSASGATRGATKTFTVRCEWQYQSNGDAVIYIYFDNTNIYSRI